MSQFTYPPNLPIKPWKPGKYKPQPANTPAAGDVMLPDTTQQAYDPRIQPKIEHLPHDPRTPVRTETVTQPAYPPPSIAPTKAKTGITDVVGAMTDQVKTAAAYQPSVDVQRIKEQTQRMREDNDAMAERTRGTNADTDAVGKDRQGVMPDATDFSSMDRAQEFNAGPDGKIGMGEKGKVRFPSYKDPSNPYGVSAYREEYNRKYGDGSLLFPKEEELPLLPKQTPEEAQKTVDDLNAKYYPELADKDPADRTYGFAYDPKTDSIKGVGSPDQQARAEREKADRLARAQTDMTEARAAGISIGELRQRRRELSQAAHEAEVAEAKAGQTTTAAGSSKIFGERVAKSADQVKEAARTGQGLEDAVANYGRTMQDEQLGPYNEGTSTAEINANRKLFNNHIADYMSAIKIPQRQAMIYNKALSELSMADVRGLLKNPYTDNAAELEEELALAMGDDVLPEDLKGLGVLLLNAYGKKPLERDAGKGTPKEPASETAAKPGPKLFGLTPEEFEATVENSSANSR